MKAIKITGFLILMILGIAMFIYGGYDDSPGGQLLGAAAVIGSIIGIVMHLKKK